MYADLSVHHWTSNAADQLRRHFLEQSLALSAQYKHTKTAIVPVLTYRSSGTVHTVYLGQGTSYQCGDTDSYSDSSSGSPPKFNHLFVGPLPTLPAEISCKSVGKFFSQTNRQTGRDRQPNNDDYITSSAEVAINKRNT